MPLTDQEKRCIDLTCGYLDRERGGMWKMQGGDTLDDLHPTVPSPEVIVTNGSETAAVEVKRITGDSSWDAYWQSFLSIRRRLVPSCGGSYLLSPFLDFRYPMERDLMRIVKSEIERVAPSLSPGDGGAIRIPRSAAISLIQAEGPGHIYCSHTATGGELQALSPRLTGTYWLVDSDQWEHAFVTDEAVEDFYRALSAACSERARGGSAIAKWYEEWDIRRLDDDGSPDEVSMIVVTDARDTIGAASDALRTRLAAAQPKFASMRWADMNIVVLENLAGIVFTPEALAEAALSFGSDEMTGIDMALLVDGGVTRLWPA